MRRQLALMLLLAAVLAGCGEKEDVLEPQGSKHVELMLDYFPNADHAGIYAAQASGEFERAGLDVEIQAPPDAAVLVHPSKPIVMHFDADIRSRLASGLQPT